MTVERTLDAGRLERYLALAQPSIGRISSVRQFEMALANPTPTYFLLDAASGHYVLRRKPPGAYSPPRTLWIASSASSARCAIRKCRLSAVFFCDDESVIGTVFYVMEFVPGEIYSEPDLPHMTPAQRAKAYDELNRVIAALHSIDPNAVGLADFGNAGNYAERQIARWTKQYRAS